MKLFFSTMGFLTRFPVGKWGGELLEKEEFAKGIVFYPLIGLIIGIYMMVVYCGASYFVQGFFPVVLGLLCQIIITGGFHLDGLADTCDGLFSARKPERMLEIMRDSRVGTNGVIAIVFDILCKVFLLGSLSAYQSMIGFLLMPVAGKMVTPLLMKSPYARKEGGLGSLYVRENYSAYFWISMISGMVFLVLGYGVMAVVPISICFLGGFFFREYCKKIIGGMTGDTLGAGCELVEILFLMSIVGMKVVRF